MEGFRFFHFFYLLVMKKIFFSLIAFISFGIALAQNTSYWQQHVDYKMDVIVDAKNYQYKGTQKLVYTNNSPDTRFLSFVQQCFPTGKRDGRASSKYYRS